MVRGKTVAATERAPVETRAKTKIRLDVALVERKLLESREKAARVILGQAEMEIAHSFQEAAKSYQNNPTALHLRAMNMLYEGLKEKGALMLIPSSAVESMGMGGMLGAAALNQERLVGGDEKDGEKVE